MWEQQFLFSFRIRAENFLKLAFLERPFSFLLFAYTETAEDRILAESPLALRSA